MKVITTRKLTIPYHTASYMPPGTDITGLNLQTRTFTFKKIKAATNDFYSANKIWEGDFGPVYKVLLV